MKTGKDVPTEPIFSMTPKGNVDYEKELVIHRIASILRAKKDRSLPGDILYFLEHFADDEKTERMTK